MVRRFCLLQHTTEGNIEGTRSQERRRKHLLHDLKEKRRYHKIQKGLGARCEEFAWRRGADLSQDRLSDDDENDDNGSLILSNTWALGPK